MLPGRGVKRNDDKPPLVEAIFEVFAKPSSDPESDGAAELRALEEEAARLFPGKKETVQAVGVKLAFGPDGPKVQQAPDQTPQYRFWAADSSELFQFSPVMCAYNLLSHYTRFEDHVEGMRQAFALWLDHVQPGAIAWAGQRYVNRVLVPESEEPRRYFEVYPELPAAVHGPFALQVVADSFPGGQTVVGLSFQGVHQGQAGYILDLYARSSEALETDAENLVAWQVKAHESVRKVFKLVLTSDARTLFGG